MAEKEKGSAPEQDAPTPRRQLLEKLLGMATTPTLQQLLQEELDAEIAVQEHLHLASLAEMAGEQELAKKIADSLIELVGQGNPSSMI